MTTIDTADIYSVRRRRGDSRRGAARAAATSSSWSRRDSCGSGTGPHDIGLSRKHLIAGCEASLRRLQTDYIDLYLCHQPDMIVPVEETMRAFDDLVRQGKVRYIGCSNNSAWQVMKALARVRPHRARHAISASR